MTAVWVAGGATGGSLASPPSSALAAALSTAPLAQPAEAAGERAFFPNPHAVVS